MVEKGSISPSRPKQKSPKKAQMSIHFARKDKKEHKKSSQAFLRNHPDSNAVQMRHRGATLGVTDPQDSVYPHRP